MALFKAYDIRGVYPTEINEDIAEKIGFAFSQWLGKGPIAIGRDMRESGILLEKAIAKGILASNTDVVSIGFCSTPMLNFAVAQNGYAGGIMITASHNPAHYNGLKLCRELGIPISGDTGLKEIEHYTKNNDKTNEISYSEIFTEEIFHKYKSFSLDKIKLGPKPIKLVIDCGNGVAGSFEFPIIQSVIQNAIGMYLEPDGSFPNHEANPLVDKNLDDLKKKVLEEKADAGIAFDGDADRVFFVDNQGKTIQGDLLLTLMAIEELKKNKNAGILYDLRSSWAVWEEIIKNGGVPILSRVGHSFIKQTMREQNATIGGELSGHFYFREFGFLDVGILAALKVIEIMSKNDLPLSDLIAPLDRYPRTGEVNFVVEDPSETMECIQRKFEQTGKTTELDGLSVEFDDWWFNVRKSNTEPFLRLNLQAKTESLLKEKYELMTKFIGGKLH